ncbi:MAG: hypothetical protein AWM53_01022 [Candidatus Dichloromethanomonas elyunquensis]|nr:MAG: hypothetical protein AWM53_01022 [Candidatus Dichloromethanomonas elyunquensis]
MDKKIGKPEERNINWTFITQAASENEANIIESVMDSEGIPVAKRYRESGDYLRIYMGMTNLGVDIYVPEDMAERAQILLVNGFEDNS